MKKTLKITGLCLPFLLPALTMPAFAQDAQDTKEVEKKDRDSHGPIDSIVVTSDPIGRSQGSIGQGIAVLSGDALDRVKSSTLGATLDAIPGMSQSSFGPAASRPIIRGLGGDRIRILTAGIGSIDASSTSPDHAVAVDPDALESIEIIRGPATLLFGNNAVGGVVNVFDGRIPTKQKESIDGFASAAFATNGDEKNGSLWLTGPLGDKFNFHLDLNAMERDNMSIPGFAESAQLRALEEDEGDDHDDEEFGVVSATDSRKKSGALGLTYFGDSGYLGVSFSGYDTNYGVPGHHHEEDPMAIEVDTTRIDLTQYRADVQGEWDFNSGFLEKIRMRFGYADYEHAELEGGAIGTTFFNKGYEGRVEGRIRSGDALSGAVGIQAKHRDYKAIGDESFVPPSITNQWGTFVLLRWEKNDLMIEGGARLENQTINVDTLGIRRKTTGTSFSGAVVKSFEDGWRLAVNGFRTERAPNAEELLSFGPHVATHTFEIGNINLGKETAKGIEASLRKVEGELTGSFSAFYTTYDDFIFQEIRDGVDEELPEAVYMAADTRFWGLEGELSWHLLEKHGGLLDFKASFDMVHATNTVSNQPIPRIPPFSVNFGAEWSESKMDIGVDITLTSAQKRLSARELPTNGFVDVGAHINYRPYGDTSPLTLSLVASNLFNDDIRHHTSFLKDLLPEAGRDIKIRAKYQF